MKQWALITGASTGIGRELTRVFAAHGYGVVLVARNEAGLRAIGEEVQARHGVEYRVIAQDLGVPGAARRIFEQAQPLAIEVLVNNAGFGAYGRFAESELGKQSALMQVNMVALVELTHHFAQPMLERGRGRILNVASVAAFVPGPTVSLYYASKAFVYSFSYALAEEMEPKGITVTTLCPGSTRTEFFERAGVPQRRPYPMMDARSVAEAGYKGLMRGKRVVIPGLTNKLMAAAVKRWPPRIPARIVQRIHAGK